MRQQLIGLKVKYSLGVVISNFGKEVSQALDIYSDLKLAQLMYIFGREQSEEQYDYNICFSWIMLATFGPFIIQFSTYMNLLYHKEWYTNKKFKKAGKCKQLFLIVTLTCLGAVVMLMIDIM